LWILLICGLALVVRLYCLDCYGLWYDEVASIEIAGRGVAAILTDRFGGMLVQTPLHYLIVWLAIHAADPAATPVFVRLPSAVAGALVPLVTYGLGRETFGKACGLVAALLVALAPVQIIHAHDVRPYTLLTLFTALSVYCLLRGWRCGSPWWWAAFALATIADVHISYFALTLFLPALSPLLVWMLYRLWSHPARTDRVYALASFTAIGVASVPALLDLLHVVRATPDLTALPGILGAQLVVYTTRLAPTGIGGRLEEVLHWTLLLLASWGAVVAIRARRVESLALCLLLVLVPAILLAAFRTTNIVFQRYALFAVPFYYLMVSNGLVSLASGAHSSVTRTMRPRLGKAVATAGAGAVGAGVLMLFSVGAFLYFNPDEHWRLSYLPDYRGAARYLSEKAGPRDLIVMADEPALGMAVVNFYWHGVPPAPVYDARDPRLFSHPAGGSIYWVVSFFQNDRDFMHWFSAPDQGWAEVRRFERIVVVREDSTSHLLTSFDRLVGKLERETPDYQPVKTLRGCVYQAQGRISQAAQAYREAGPYYPRLGEEFFVSAQGYARRGDMGRAWREAITSKFMRPDNPDLHTWMAASLQQQGYPAESLTEALLAQLLRPAGSERR
jgi:hypothetical protein